MSEEAVFVGSVVCASVTALTIHCLQMPHWLRIESRECRLTYDFPSSFLLPKYFSVCLVVSATEES